MFKNTIRYKVETYEVTLNCSECKNGEMKSLPKETPSPKSYLHECTNCGETIWIKYLKYPYIEFEKVKVVTSAEQQKRKLKGTRSTSLGRLY